MAIEYGKYGSVGDEEEASPARRANADQHFFSDHVLILLE